MSTNTDAEAVVHYTRCDLAGTAPVLDLVTGVHNRIVVQRPRLLRPRQTPLACARDAVLGLPWSESGTRHFIAFLLTSVARALEVERPIVLVVGHAAVGESLEVEAHRVRSVQLVVEGDRAGWVQHATDAGSLDEIHGYLRHLTRNRGWSCAPEGLDGREVADDVYDFQAEFFERHGEKIETDGVCGVQTLGAVFDVVRWEWDTWLADRELARADIDAANVHYVPAGGLDRKLRQMEALGDVGGLDVLVGSLDDLTGPGDVALAYASEVVREEQYDVHWHFVHDDLRVRLSPEGGPHDVLPWGVLLEDQGGDVREIREVSSGRHYPDGAVEVTFTGVACRGIYTLSLLAGPDAPREVMLAKVTYEELLDDRRPLQEVP